MSFIELLSFCKVFSVAVGLDSERILSKRDLEITEKALERRADELPYLSPEQREAYKLLFDFVKEKAKNYI